MLDLITPVSAATTPLAPGDLTPAGVVPIAAAAGVFVVLGVDIPYMDGGPPAVLMSRNGTGLGAPCDCRSCRLEGEGGCGAVAMLRGGVAAAKACGALTRSVGVTGTCVRMCG
eukprot:592981-Pelagomonas_calceolata.AAC.10